MLLNNLRNKNFWFLDTLKGNLIKRHLDLIVTVLDDPKSDTSINLKQKCIQDLITHATTTTTFYNSYRGVNNLDDFPVIKKSLIQDNFTKFQSNKYIGKKNYKIATSGSTGLSFFLFQNKNKRLRNYADTIYYYSNSGYTIGNRIYKLIVWHSNNKKNRLEAWLQNISQFDVSNLTDERIEYLIDMLKNDNQKNKVFICYSSVLELIAKYLEKKNLFLENLGINSIVAISEYLNKYTKETLEKHLQIPVISRYSNEELGMIAQQTIASPNTFKVNHASYHVEVLGMNNNEHVKPGEFGRIVVTDLYNYAMPMIRYDTGDIACYKLDHNNVMQLDQIEGRKMDVIYNTKGRIISSFITHAIFNSHYKQLNQYQFIQQGRKKYEVKLNIQGESFGFEDELINKVKVEFGHDADVKISYVDEIPPLSSGKRRKVINNYLRD